MLTNHVRVRVPGACACILCYPGLNLCIMEDYAVLRTLVDACIYIFHNLSAIDPTDSQALEVKKVLGFIARNCNDIYVSRTGDIFKIPEND